MKKIAFLLTLVMWVAAATATPVFAAANPMPSASAPSTTPMSPNSAPPAFLQALKTMQENKYAENEIKSFVYHIYYLFDRHPEVNQLLFYFSDQELDMRVPEGQIASTKDFEKWYAGLGAKYQSNIHTIEQMNVTVPAKGNYLVDLTVQFQALGRDGKYVTNRTRHMLQLVDGGEYWPRVVGFIVEPVR